MEEHAQVITLYLPADFEKEFADFKFHIENDIRIKKTKLTKKEQYVSLGLRTLMTWYNSARRTYYKQLAESRKDEKQNANSQKD